MGIDQSKIDDLDKKIELYCGNRFADEDVRRYFPYQTMSPEEYAARHSHAVECYAYGCFQYKDSAIGIWARRLGAILDDPTEIENCRKRFLTPDEYIQIKEHIVVDRAGSSNFEPE